MALPEWKQHTWPTSDSYMHAVSSMPINDSQDLISSSPTRAWFSANSHAIVAMSSVYVTVSSPRLSDLCRDSWVR